jgi:hypothetical protein
VLERIRATIDRTLAAGQRRVRRAPPETWLAALIAGVSGVVVFTVASTVFAYHSSNHDEAVYLMQAAMLLEGQLELHAGELADAFHPWFFIEDGGRLYPKYSPVPSAMYAVTMGLLGEPRVTLAAVAAANAFLVYRLASMAWDRRVGVVAAVVFAAAPMAVVTTSVFLPYAPTTALNLAFAVAYLRGVREESIRWGVLAGIAVGIAFFSRPYTAVLFAAPFIAHAGYAVIAAGKDEGVLGRIRERGPDALRWGSLPSPIRRNLATALFGLLFVGVTLAYNARMTGSATTFPYAVFAPLDGPGFGRRRILGHSIVYTPELALRANGYVLWYLLTRWFTAGALGSAAAAGGLAVALRRWSRAGRRRAARMGEEAGGRSIGKFDDRSLRAPDDRSIRGTSGKLLAGLFVTVPLGNVAFWGNYNVLATMDDPTNGIVSQFGPIYHFDLLVPLSVFAAIGVVVGWRRAREAIRDLLESDGTGIDPDGTVVRACLAAVVLAGVLLVGGANAAVVAEPVDRNAAHAEKYETAYEPIETAEFENALVIIPAPYGEWQNHPFQYLRNDPGFDGPVVYALDRDPGEDFTVFDAYPDREYHRYTYRGEWTPTGDRHVTPRLERIEVRRGAVLEGEATVGIPDRVTSARVRIEGAGDEHASYVVADPDGSLAVPWRMDAERVRLPAAGSDGGEDAVDAAAVPVPEDDGRVSLSITLTQPDGGTLTYRQDLDVRVNEGDGSGSSDADAEGRDGSVVEVVWPPERKVCRLATDCGREGTYLPNHPDAHLDGVSFETSITTGDEERDGDGGT